MALCVHIQILLGLGLYTSYTLCLREALKTNCDKTKRML